MNHEKLLTKLQSCDMQGNPVIYDDI